MKMNNLSIRPHCPGILRGFIFVISILLMLPVAFAKDHPVLAHESSSADHIDELDDIMEEMGDTLKAIRKSSDLKKIHTYAIKLKEYVGMAAQHQLRDEEENAYFKQGMVELMEAVDQLVTASKDGEGLDEAIDQVLSTRKKYHEKLGV